MKCNEFSAEISKEPFQSFTNRGEHSWWSRAHLGVSTDKFHS